MFIVTQNEVKDSDSLRKEQRKSDTDPIKANSCEEHSLVEVRLQVVHDSRQVSGRSATSSVFTVSRQR